MNVEIMSLSSSSEGQVAQLELANPNLILYFDSRQRTGSGQVFDKIRAMCPGATIVGCTTGGQIHHTDIVDDEFTGVALRFETTRIRLIRESVDTMLESYTCGRRLGEKLKASDLAAVFVLSDGLNVNGSRLVAGMTEAIGGDVPVTGGLAGDGARFEQTLVAANATPQSHTVAGLGFYGPDIRIGHGSAGGWDVFGPSRRITRSHDNVLFNLDREAALDLYERYLGDEAEGLPGTALLFPLQIHDPSNPKHKIVRTVLGIDREARSLTFAGDVPEGWNAQLMRGSFDRLADGAADAARQSLRGLAGAGNGQGVALLVSCIGRRLLMGQRIAEEAEAAGLELGPDLRRLGFYSYGELAPHAESGRCELHNQTMTITTITEVASRTR